MPEPAPTAGRWTVHDGREYGVVATIFCRDGNPVEDDDVLDALNRAEAAPDLTALRQAAIAAIDPRTTDYERLLAARRRDEIAAVLVREHRTATMADDLLGRADDLVAHGCSYETALRMVARLAEALRAESAEAEVRALNDRPAPPPTALWSLAEDEATYIDIESAIHQHMGHDGQSDETNDWVTDLMAAIAPFIERAVNSRAEAAPDLTALQQAVIDAAVDETKAETDPRSLSRLEPPSVTIDYARQARRAAVAALVRDTPDGTDG